MRKTFTRGAITLAAAPSSIVFTGLQAQAEPVDHPASQPDDTGSAQAAPAPEPDTAADSAGGADRAAAPDGSGAADGTGAAASSEQHDSPGILSGNSLQLGVSAPVNVCGNSVTAAGVGNAAFGNECANGSAPVEEPTPEPTPATPPASPHPAPPRPAPQPVAHTVQEELAATGNGAPTGALAAAGAGLLVGGALLYRRSRHVPAQHRSV